MDAGTNSPDSLAEEEAQRAAALLVAMRPSSQADDADDAAKGLPRGGAGRKDGRGRSAPAARASVLFSEKGGSPKRRGKAGARGRGGSRGGRASSRGGGARRQPGVPFFGGGGEMQATTSPPEKQVAALAASGAKSGGAAKKRKGISRFERGGSSSGAEKDVAGEKDTVPRARGEGEFQNSLDTVFVATTARRVTWLSWRENNNEACGEMFFTTAVVAVEVAGEPVRDEYVTAVCVCISIFGVCWDYSEGKGTKGGGNPASAGVS